jgi:hypothetical protein
VSGKGESVHPDTTVLSSKFGNKNKFMNQISLKQLLKTGVINNISGLRSNTNDYPFVTLLNGNKSTNVYFGKKSSEKILTEFTPDVATEKKAFYKAIADATIVETANADGEVRYKLSLSGSSDYATAAELMDVFGLDEVATEFDVTAFRKEFQAVVEKVGG